MRTATSVVALLLAWTTALAVTEVFGPIGSDTTWTAANSPYIVTSSVSILPAATLTFLPGTVIKVAANESPFYVQGTFIIGTASGAPVVVTSITDDTVGGDTNGDVSATPLVIGGGGIGDLCGELLVFLITSMI